MNKPKIKIDIISDIVCPWCYIGKRRLEKAVDQLKNDYSFELRYHPFELNPDMPAEGLEQKSYLTEKFGGSEKYEKVVGHITHVGAEEGIAFNYAIQKMSPNTMDMHRIIWLAGKEGNQGATVEAFYKAYFESGTDLTRRENLVSIASGAGLEAAKVTGLLNSEEGAVEVRAFESYCQQIGVNGVPFFIINDKYAISGAQPADVLVKALPDIASKMAAEGPSCDLDGNC